jgi:hypothetical protein
VFFGHAIPTSSGVTPSMPILLTWPRGLRDDSMAARINVLSIGDGLSGAPTRAHWLACFSQTLVCLELFTIYIYKVKDIFIGFF